MSAYIACEDINMIWDSSEVETFRQAYKENPDIRELAVHFKRSTDEIALLIIDLGSRGLIKGRKP